MTITMDQPADRAEADAAVLAVVDCLQHAQATEDVAMFSGLLREDAVWTTATGRRLIGRPEIAEFTASVLPGAMQEMMPTYDVTHIVWVRPDVAIATVAQAAVDLDGNPVDGVPHGRPTYVIARGDDGWWQLVAGQNTRISA